VSRWFPEHTVLWLWPHKTDVALAAFERELDQRALRRGTRLSCVVAGEGVRYRVVPWNDELASPLQRQVLAMNCFTEAYGDAARGWTLRQQPARHGAATLACALDAALLDRLAALAQARQLKLVSVQPALMHAYNLGRERIDAGLHWFVCIDGPWITLLLMSQGQPLLVKSLSSSNADLGRVLDREWFVLGVETPRCPVYVTRRALAAGAEHKPFGTGWHFVDLPPLPGEAASHSLLPSLQAA